MKSKLCLFAVCGLLCAICFGQWLETTIPTPGGARPWSLCHNPRDNKVYAVCNTYYPDEDSMLVIVDAAQNSVITSLRLGTAMGNACCDSNEGKVYVACQSTQSVFVIDGAGDSVLAEIPVNRSAWYVLYEPVRNRVYCAAPWNSVVVIDCSTGSVVATMQSGEGAYALCHNPLTDRLYCANFGGSTLSVFDCATCSPVATVNTDSGPIALCVNTTDNKVYSANLYGNNVTVVDGTTDTVIATVGVGGGPQELCWSQANDKIYVSNGNSRSVSVISGSENRVVRTITVDYGPSGLLYNSLNDRVYCANTFSGSVSIINGQTDQVVKALQVGTDPMSFTWNPAENRTYVSCNAAASIAVIRDSMTGIKEGRMPPNAAVRTATSLPTIVRSELFLPPASSVERKVSSVLLDINGRKVLDLKTGANDVSRLSPGVYFVREAGAQAQAVRKVVIQR